MGKILTNHKKVFLKGKQRATYPEFDRDDWAFEEILGGKNSLPLKMSQPVAEPPPCKHMVSKTITRRDFYSVLYRSDGSLYPQVQVHTFEGLPH